MESIGACGFCNDDLCEMCLRNERVFSHCGKKACLEALEGEKSKAANPPRNGFATVGRYRTSVDARLALTKLQSAGMEGFIKDEYDPYQGLTSGSGLALQVERSDLGEALVLLGQPADIELPSSPLKCPSCGSASNPGDYFCPSCGHALSGEDESISVQRKSLEEKDPTPGPEKWDFRWAVLFCLAIEAFNFSPGMAWVLFFEKPDHAWRPALGWVNFASDILGIFLAVFLVTRIKSLSWRDGFRFLGFKRIEGRYLGAAFFLSFMLLGSYFVFLWGCLLEGGDIGPRNHPAAYFWKFLLPLVALEEVVYRGFLFQLLRPGRSFFSAAALSGSLWALSHLGRLLPGGYPTGDTFQSVMVLMFFVFIDSFAAAYFFERSGCVIWGWLLVHLALDSSGLYVASGIDFHPGGLLLEICRWGEWVFAPLAFLVAWRLSPAKPEPPPQKGLGDTSAPMRLARFFLPFVLAFMAGLFIYMPSTRQLNLERINAYHGNRAREHPRWAGAYLSWAGDLFENGMNAEAIDKCQKALLIDPRNSRAHLLWGRILCRMKNYNEADAQFEQVTEIKPRYAPTYLCWGIALERLKRYGQAVEKYRTVLGLKPDATYLSDYAGHAVEDLERWYPAQTGDEGK